MSFACSLTVAKTGTRLITFTMIYYLKYERMFVETLYRLALLASTTTQQLLKQIMKTLFCGSIFKFTMKCFVYATPNPVD